MRGEQKTVRRCLRMSSSDAAIIDAAIELANRGRSWRHRLGFSEWVRKVILPAARAAIAEQKPPTGEVSHGS